MREFAPRTLTDPEPRTKFGEDDKPDDDIDDFQPRRALYEGGSDDEENDQDVKAQQGEIRCVGWDASFLVILILGVFLPAIERSLIFRNRSGLHLSIAGDAS